MVKELVAKVNPALSNTASMWIPAPARFLGAGRITKSSAPFSTSATTQSRRKTSKTVLPVVVFFLPAFQGATVCDSVIAGGAYALREMVLRLNPH